MHKLAPFNATILDPNEYIERKNILPVTSMAMYETSTERFHPDGLYSEAIFGQIGSRDRLIKRGYIDLKTDIITPHLYAQIITLKQFYKEVISGKTYAYFDNELKDLAVTTSDDPRGRTGYAFFLEMLPKIKFNETDSNKRQNKLELIYKFKNKWFIDKLIVLPAGVRDVKIKHGRAAPEEINKYYLALMSLTKSLPLEKTSDPIFDGIRYQIQMKVQEIYEYIWNILDGKGGFSQGKYMRRGVVYSNRNVITSAPLTRVNSPESPNAYSADEVYVPLYQAMKGAVPLVAYKLHKVIFDPIFNNQTTNIPLIKKVNDEYITSYEEIENEELSKFTTSEGITGLINGFRNVEIQKEPATCLIMDRTNKLNIEERKRFLELVYDNGTDIYTFRNVNDFVNFYEHKQNYNLSNIGEQIEVLKEFEPTDFILIGSAACLYYGMQDYENSNLDLDIIVSDNLLKQIKTDKRFKATNTGYYSEELKIDVNPIDYIRDNKGFKDLWDNRCTTDNNNIHILSAKDLLEMYKSNTRVKDYAKIHFLKNIVVDYSCIRPMTWVEIFYIATQAALLNKYGTATRHPVLLIENIQLYKIHLMSTSPGRIVKLHTLSDTTNSFSSDKSDHIILPEYPCLDKIVKTSMSVHPSTLSKYDGKQ